jgi:ubiquinone/menaquinone biosynthesis C-methylase UbiE
MMSFSGWAYDACLGPLLRGMRLWVAAYVRENGLFPALDLCTGTGAMCRNFDHQPTRTVWGVDLDDRLLRYARSKAPSVAFVQADAARLPIRADGFRSVIISYALHDKQSYLRKAMMAEVRRVLHRQGKALFIDFESPWDMTSRLGRVLTYGIERTAGGDHFRNGQQFLHEEGGLRGFLSSHGWEELESREFPWGNSRAVVARKME